MRDRSSYKRVRGNYFGKIPRTLDCKEMDSQHGADFNENFSEVITIDTETIGATGQEGYLAGMDANFVNTDNSMTVDISNCIENDQVLSHAVNDLRI